MGTGLAAAILAQVLVDDALDDAPKLLLSAGVAVLAGLIGTAVIVLLHRSARRP